MPIELVKPLTCATLWLRFKRLIGLRKCYLTLNRIEGDWGIWRCHCGAEKKGFKRPITIGPGETVTITIGHYTDA